MRTQTTLDHDNPDPSSLGGKRCCAVSRMVLPKTQMIRFVLSPSAEVTPDIDARLPGRGLWISAKSEIVKQAIKSNSFSRGLKYKVSIPSNLITLIEQLLVKKCQNLLGFARKSGRAVIGYEQVEAEIKYAPPGWVLEAEDARHQKGKKLSKLGEQLYGSINLATKLSTTELGIAFGRGHVVHGLIKRGRLAKKWAVEYRRLEGFR